MRALWLFWMWTLLGASIIGCLKLTVSPRMIFRRWDEASTSLFFTSLNYCMEPTTKNLPRLLSFREIPIWASYQKINPSKLVAEELVSCFIGSPEIHQFVLPFSLYYQSRAIQDALAVNIASYRPKNLYIFADSGNNTTIDNAALLKIAESIPYLYLAIDSVKIARQLILADYERFQGLYELSHWSFDEFNVGSRLEKYGKVGLLAAVSIKHDLIYYPYQKTGEMREVSEFIIKQSKFSQIFAQTFEGDDQYLPYLTLMGNLNDATKHMQICERALWAGKFLIVIAYNNYSTKQEMEELYISYLNEYPLESIPRIILYGLELIAQKTNLFISCENNQVALAIRHLDKILPFGGFMQYDLSRHINRVYDRIKSITRIKSLDSPSCDICSVVELIDWWGGFESMNSITLIDIDTFPNIKIDLGETRVVCRNLRDLLQILSDVFLYSSRLFGQQTDKYVYAKAYVRTFAYSLLYHFSTSLTLSKYSINTLYSTGNGKTGELKGLLLKQIGFDMIPKALLFDEMRHIARRNFPGSTQCHVIILFMLVLFMAVLSLGKNCWAVLLSNYF